MTTTFTGTLTFAVVVCAQCQVPFGISSRQDECFRETKATFYCPHGHSQSYRESELERVKRQLVSVTATKERLETEVRHKGVMLEQEREARVKKEKSLARLKKRIGKGVCPHCNRYFPNVHKHMETEHSMLERAEPL